MDGIRTMQVVLLVLCLNPTEHSPQPPTPARTQRHLWEFRHEGSRPN